MPTPHNVLDIEELIFGPWEVQHAARLAHAMQNKRLIIDAANDIQHGFTTIVYNAQEMGFGKYNSAFTMFMHSDGRVEPLVDIGVRRP
jgi:hypothetical protein